MLTLSNPQGNYQILVNVNNQELEAQNGRGAGVRGGGGGRLAVKRHFTEIPPEQLSHEN